MNNDDQTSGLRRRIESGLSVVSGWNDNKDLMLECRKELLQEDLTKYSENDEYPLLSGLCRWFQKNMTWVNEPPCEVCEVKDHMKLQHVRQAMSAKEREGKASRVEVYECATCLTSTSFARYNCVRTLWKERRGRCGEYANLFGFLCSSMGMTVRYILDSTDHVWVEVLGNQNRWIMADGCEGQIDQPGMYEQGWGKKNLNCILAFHANTHAVTDVTPRYTRQYSTLVLQPHRQILKQLITQYNNQKNIDMNKEPCDQFEQQYFTYLMTHNPPLTWQPHEYTNQGRQSGSLAWRALRHELGIDPSSSTMTVVQKKNAMSTVEHFLPHLSPSSIDIQVSPFQIKISQIVLQTKLASKDEEESEDNTCIFMTVVEETNGCILQTRKFHDWSIAKDFIDTVPNGRILALSSSSSSSNGSTAAVITKETMSLWKQISLRLGGFPTAFEEEEESNDFCLLFIGQVNHCPDWCQSKVIIGTEFASTTISICLKLNDDNESSKVSISLQKAPNTVPKQIVGRLPDSILSLSKQLGEGEANNEEEILQAFQTYQKHHPNIIGFTTRPSCPIYLISQSAYPLTTTNNDTENENITASSSTSNPYETIPWTTYYSLPTPLITKVKSPPPSSSSISFEIPVEETLIDQVIGPNLLSSSDNALVETSQVLKSVRLIGLYFSAHWCGPCRSFTPKLDQFYKICRQELKLPIELVFVSSDRSEQEFQQYFQSSMSWYAIPFQSANQTKQFFNVRGIPSLIILDSISGQIVVPSQQSRNDIIQTFSNDDSIRHLVQNTWMNQIPEESQMIYETLALSCQEDEAKDDNNKKPNPYLVLEKSPSPQIGEKKKHDPSQRIQELFLQLTQTDGMEPNAAAAKAIQILSQEQQKQESTTPKLSAGNLTSTTKENNDENDGSPTEVVKIEVAKIILKYVNNARKHPNTPKFRSIKVSNKVFDKIMSMPGGILHLLNSGHLQLHHTQTDFYATIPLDADLEEMQKSLSSIVTSE